MTDRPTEPQPLPWTGERYLPDVHGNIELEHVHRYLLASRLSLGKRVLDIACGEGYGSSLLAQSAVSVVGVDIASEAVAHARARYPSKNLTFEIGSCAAIPLPDHSVDVVVSFETIEHHHEHDAMMREIKRVLVPGGVLVISSPDRLEYSDRPNYANPYHVRELYRAEFASLLKTYFRHHHMSGQRIVYGSAIFNEDSAGRVCSFGINDKVMLPAPGIARALYLLAVASDAELPMAESGLLEQPIAESDDVRERHKQIVALSQSLGERDGRIAALDQAIAGRDGRVADLEQAVAERDERIVGLDAAVMERHEQIAHLLRVVAQREESIASLERAAASAEARLADLTEVVADRDARIGDLGGVVAERTAQIARLDGAVVERDGRIAALDHAVTERDGQISRLARTVADQDERIGAFDRAASARERLVADLASAAAARDAQIAMLERSIAERDRCIAGLERSAVERDERDIELGRSIAVRDGQVADLLRAVTERDDRIAGLDRAATERDRQIADLRRALAEREEQLHAQAHRISTLLHSRSWRWTGPLRLVTGPARTGIRSFRDALDRRTSRLPFVRQMPIRRVRRHSLFDQSYYLLENPDVRAAGIDPATHYAEFGWREHRDASARFSTSAYLRDHPDVAAAGVNPLLHYIDHGQAEGRLPRLASRPVERLSLVPDSGTEATPASLAWSVEGMEAEAESEPAAGAPVHPPGSTGIDGAGLDSPDTATVFEADHEAPAAVSRPVPDPGRIDIEIEAIAASGLFDAAYYLAMHPDLQPPPTDPLRHYCTDGWREGRNPSDEFDTRGYLNTYSDIRDAEINPFWHYVVAGASECRQGAPNSSLQYEDDVHFRNVESDVRLIAFYTTPDWDRVRAVRSTGIGNRLTPHKDLGFYAATDRDTLQSQARMARRHGVKGWCFTVHADAVPTEQNPVVAFLAAPQIELGFCLELDLRSAWIEEPAIDYLKRAFEDTRYLKIAERPVLILTLPEQGSVCYEMLKALGALFSEESPKPYRLVRLTSTAHQAASVAATFECEAILDLPVDPVPGETGDFQPLDRSGIEYVPYSIVASQGIARIDREPAPIVPVFRAITLSRDHAPVDPSHPLRYSRFRLKDYRRWLDTAIADARAKHDADRRLLFINAWNDWDHGIVLEPDRSAGYCKLNETSRALLGLASGVALPLVTVVVPNFNHAPYLSRRLESIYRQTYQNIEVLLMDDCSTDHSRTILTEYAEEYPEVTTLLFNESNSGGVFRQWAKGIKAAAGSLIWVAESDDYCEPDFLEKLVRCFDDEAVMLAYSKIEFVHADESVMPDYFSYHVRDLIGRDKWKSSFVNTAHREVCDALGIINTIPNASGTVFRRPVRIPLLDDEAWLSMAVVGDWVFYLHLLRGGKVAFSAETVNYFRRHDESTAASTYHKEKFYRELGVAARAVQELYDVPHDVLAKSRLRAKEIYDHYCGSSDEEFDRWFDVGAALEARTARTPNILVSTSSFHPGGAEILPIRIANELKRTGYSVLVLSSGLNEREDGVRRMLRNDVPVVETPSIQDAEALIRDFGIEILNSHQWNVQKYPNHLSSVFSGLKAHVASLHGMIEHGDAFGVTAEQLQVAHDNVTTWVYTADKNLGPFIDHGLYARDVERFVKLPNGMEPPTIVAVPRSELGFPADAFVLCCVSRAIPDKGWAEAIEAVALARASSSRDIRLILVGKGPVHDEYVRTGVPDFVYLAGFSENSVGFYAAADMGIMLTRFRSESFPLTIVDCLFAGKPYISCDVGEIRNMLTDGDDMAGAIVPLLDWEVPVAQVADRIVEFSSDARRYADALAVVPRLATRYGIDRVVERYVEIFRDASVYREPLHDLDLLAKTH